MKRTWKEMERNYDEMLNDNYGTVAEFFKEKHPKDYEKAVVEFEKIVVDIEAENEEEEDELETKLEIIKRKKRLIEVTRDEILALL